MCGKRRDDDEFKVETEFRFGDSEKKAEQWGSRFEERAEAWGRRMEARAERFAERMTRREERREERRERRAARREGRAMRGHFRHGEYGTTLYRSRSGMVCGVCKGFAQYYGFDVFWTRAGMVALALMTTFWPCVIAYVIAAMVMKPEPVLPLESAEDEEFYNSYSGSRTMALQRLKRTYDNLNRRIQRLESAVTARDFDWDERLNR